MLRPSSEKAERALRLQLAPGPVLDGLPFFVGSLDVASNVLIPALSYRGRKVEIELVVGDLPNSRIAVNLDAFRCTERTESAILGQVLGRILQEALLMIFRGKAIDRSIMLGGEPRRSRNDPRFASVYWYTWKIAPRSGGV
jgi:hypothetical protein